MILKSLLRSLSFRLTLFSFFLTYALLLGCWCLLYFSIDNELISRDQETITDRLKTIQNLLQVEPGHPVRLFSRIEKEWPNRPFERLYVRVFDQSEKVLTETPGLNYQDADIQQAFPRNTVKIGDKNKLEKVSIGGRIFQLGSFVMPIHDGKSTQNYFVQIALERTSEERLLSALRNSLFYIMIFGLIGSLLSGRITVNKTLQAIRKISATAQKVSSAGLQERIDPSALPIEFGELADTLNAMLKRLEDSFARLSRFSEDMAHELRTPMNNLLGSLEVGISKERSVGEYQSLLISSFEECGRLKRIIDSLLFIARAHQPAHDIHKQHMRLSSEIETIISFYEASAEKNNIVLKLEMGVHDIDLDAERVLFQRALGNLLSNAIRHSPLFSEILISTKVENNFVIIAVEDQGEGIEPELLARVGERFFRVDPSRSQALGGHGLGLSIVKSIVEIHGGQLKVESTPGRGSTFSLYFPV